MSILHVDATEYSLDIFEIPLFYWSQRKTEEKILKRKNQFLVCFDKIH